MALGDYSALEGAAASPAPGATAKGGAASMVRGRIQTPEQQQAQQAKLKKACQLFEAQFLKMLWKEMRQSVHKTGLMSGGMGEEMFTDMLDQVVSDQSSQSGSVGLASMLERQPGREAVKSPSRAGRTGGLELAPSIGSTLPSTPAAPRLNTLPGLGRYQEGRGQYAGQEASGYALPVQGTVSSAFGSRVHPVTGDERPHNGLDLSAPEGTPVVAAKSGTVSFAGDGGEYGNLVVIEHASGESTYYGHLEDVKVAGGQEIRQGQLLGGVGNTGLSTGPHLHFEVRNASGQAVDPLPLVAKGLDTAG